MALAGSCRVGLDIVIPEYAGDTVLLSCLEVLFCPVYTSLCISEVGSTHFTDNYRNSLVNEHIAEVLEIVSKVSAEFLSEGIVVSAFLCVGVHCEVVRCVSVDRYCTVIIIRHYDLIEECLI